MRVHVCVCMSVHASLRRAGLLAARPAGAGAACGRPQGAGPPLAPRLLIFSWPAACPLFPPHLLLRRRPSPAVFTRSVVLNITRKNREWRFYEFIGLRLEDLPKASAVVSDVRKILRQVRRGRGGSGRRRGRAPGQGN